MILLYLSMSPRPVEDDMKAGDMVRSRKDSRYGLVFKLGVPNRVLILWQGIGCSRTWVWDCSLITGVEHELMMWKGAK